MARVHSIKAMFIHVILCGPLGCDLFGKISACGISRTKLLLIIRVDIGGSDTGWLRWNSGQRNTMPYGHGWKPYARLSANFLAEHTFLPPGQEVSWQETNCPDFLNPKV
ncbi:MAG: hypothetical protein IPJ66_06255 [Bacteroidetes bacterium]|nr:hypothetical protein [Bacteroidota bacterium]